MGNEHSFNFLMLVQIRFWYTVAILNVTSNAAIEPEFKMLHSNHISQETSYVSVTLLFQVNVLE